MQAFSPRISANTAPELHALLFSHAARYVPNQSAQKRLVERTLGCLTDLRNFEADLPMEKALLLIMHRLVQDDIRPKPQSRRSV